MVEAHDLEIHVRNSGQMPVSGNTTGVRPTNSGTANEIQTGGIGTADGTNQLNPPVVSNYERISLSNNDDPCVRYTSYNVDQSSDKNQQDGTTLDLPTSDIRNQSISKGEQSDVGAENRTVETLAPASYDKLTFSKPPSYKLSTYHTVEGTLPREPQGM